MVTETEIREVLKQVVDPEIRIDIVNLGLVYDVKIENDFVYVKNDPDQPGMSGRSANHYRSDGGH